MAIGTYDELTAAIGTWLHREDLDEVIPDFIRLAEARFNRNLRTRAMLAEFAAVELTDGAAPLPEDFIAFKELRFSGDTRRTLQPRPLEWLRNEPVSASAPLYFALTGSEVVCSPTAGSIEGTYYQAIPALEDNATNWLLTSHPDLYLFACLVESAIYAADDARIPLFAERAAALIEQVQGQDNGNALNGGPLTARVR